MNKQEILQTFISSRKRQVNKNITIIVLFIVLFWGIGIFMYFTPKVNSAPLIELIFGLFFGLTPVVITIYCILDLKKSRLDKNKIYQTFLNDPEKIVWIYPAVFTYNGMPTYSIHCFDNQKNTCEVELKSKDIQDRLMKGFALHCPNALLGYRPEWSSIYYQNPSNFIDMVFKYEQQFKN